MPNKKENPFAWRTPTLSNQPNSYATLNTNFEVGYDLGLYDINQDLIIDPGLTYSTFLGGSDEDYGLDTYYKPATSDTQASIFVIGYTQSTDFPVTTGSYSGGSYDAFISRFDDELNYEVSAFLGGSDVDYGYAINMDSDGNILVTGRTKSDDADDIPFPTTNGAYQTSISGGYDVYVSKLSPDLDSLLSSTLIGGSGTEYGYSITFSDDSIFVAGYTASQNFPTTDELFFDGGIDSDGLVVPPLYFSSSDNSIGTYLNPNDSPFFKADYRNLNLNCIFKWEYMPGANFYLVWVYQKNVAGEAFDSIIDFLNYDEIENYNDVFENQSVHIKFDYWFNP